MRIVHVADADPVAPPPDGALASIATLQRHDSDAQHLLIGIGNAHFREHARRFGADVNAMVHPRSARARSRSNRLRATIESLGRVDAIQPWSSATADLAARMSDLAAPLPPAPGQAPIHKDHASPNSRARWRRRFGLGAHELAIALITDDTSPSVAGAFGLVLPPVTCTFQDQTIVGLLPGTSSGPGATRSRRYAETAGEVWRIELLEAPMHAIAAASDAVLSLGSSVNDSPWTASSAALYASRCARRLSIPVICTHFGAAPSKPLLDDAIRPTRPGNVGIAAALVEALSQRNTPTDDDRSEHPEITFQQGVQEWIAEWRRGAMAGGAECC